MIKGLGRTSLIEEAIKFTIQYILVVGNDSSIEFNSLKSTMAMSWPESPQLEVAYW
jgi:hypothetical protein